MVTVIKIESSLGRFPDTEPQLNAGDDALVSRAPTMSVT